MSFWCLAPSPLMLGGNLPDNTDADLALLTNDEVLAVDQDPLAAPAVRISQKRDQEAHIEVWVRPLQDGGRAVGLFNRGETTADISLDWAEAGLLGKWTARDLWEHKNMGDYDTRLTHSVLPHGSVLLKLTPTAK